MNPKYSILVALVLSACTFAPGVPVASPSPSAPNMSGVGNTWQPDDEHPAGAVYQQAESLPVRYVVVADGLNVRARPSAESDVVGWLEAGDTVAVREFSGTWGFVGSGWVAMRYLSLLDE